MFVITYVLQYNTDLSQLRKSIEKILIIVLIHLIGFKNSPNTKIVRKGLKYIVYIKESVLQGGYKNVEWKVMYFSLLKKCFSEDVLYNIRHKMSSETLRQSFYLVLVKF